MPAPKRRFGYYVFPVLQGDRIIGRLDAKRAGRTLIARAFWPEAGVRMGKARSSGLEAELSRIKTLAGVDDIEFVILSFISKALINDRWNIAFYEIRYLFWIM